MIAAVGGTEEAARHVAALFGLAALHTGLAHVLGAGTVDLLAADRDVLCGQLLACVEVGAGGLLHAGAPLWAAAGATALPQAQRAPRRVHDVAHRGPGTSTGMQQAWSGIGWAHACMHACLQLKTGQQEHSTASLAMCLPIVSCMGNKELGMLNTACMQAHTAWCHVRWQALTPLPPDAVVLLGRCWHLSLSRAAAAAVATAC